MAAYSKSVETLSLNADNHIYVLDRLSHLQISEVMLVGGAGMVGMFTGQSISTSTSASFPQLITLTTSLTRSPIGLSKSLSTPLNLLPSSWQLDPTLVLSQRSVPEETLLVILAEKYLNFKTTDSISEVGVTPMWPSGGDS